MKGTAKRALRPPQQLPAAFLKEWDALNDSYAPMVIGDAFGNTESIWPAPEDISWMSLYASGLLLLECLVKQARFAKPKLPQIAPNRPVETYEFFLRSYRNETDKFATFLHNWGLAPFLPQSITLPETEQYDDKRLLGSHIFQSEASVKEYVYQWSLNPDIANHELKFHQLVTEKSVDLICAELLWNGLEHSSPTETLPPTVFILAKLCTVASSNAALRLHSEDPYLTPCEQTMYSQAVKKNEDLLQIVIGDTGRGFGGNAELASLYTKETGLHKPSEADLLLYALRPSVSTRTNLNRTAKELLRIINTPGGRLPTVHGLSEIQNCVKSLGGFWRIHSGGTAVNMNYIEAAITNPSTELHTLTSDVRTIVGCLHYIVLPISRAAHRYAIHPSPETSYPEFEILDLSEVGPTTSIIQAPPSTEAHVQICCNAIDALRNGQTRPLLINIGFIDEIEIGVRPHAFVCLIDRLYRLRNARSVYLCGLSKWTESLLQRCLDSEGVFSNLVVPVVCPSSNAGIRVFCNARFNSVAPLLENLISQGELGTLVKSEIDQEQWNTLCAIRNQNPMHLRSDNIEKHDKELRGIVAGGPMTPSLLHIFLGGKSEATIVKWLIEADAIALGSHVRMGHTINGYIHVARLWSDQRYIRDLTYWAANAIEFILYSSLESSSLAANAANIGLIAVLHPAVDLAHAVADHPRFKKVQIVEIRRVGELAWDNTALQQLQSMRYIVCIFDMIETMSTLNELLWHLKQLDIRPQGILTILNCSDHKSVEEIPVAAFSVGRREQILETARNQQTIR